MHVVLDASPLIYLAKLDAFDALSNAGYIAVVPPSVESEAARPELAFRHPEVAVIERVRAEGYLLVEPPDGREVELALELADRYGGLHQGELDVLAMGSVRGWSVCLHERQASRIARALGVATTHLVEILFAGTSELDLLDRRIRAFARLTNMTMNDLDVLLELIRERR
jgi:predicted nucleic acid-binding protein